jgi:hypothetical protein
MFNSRIDLKNHITKTHNFCHSCKKNIYSHFKRHVALCNKSVYSMWQFVGESVTTDLITALHSCRLPIKWVLVRRVKFIKHTVNENGEMIIDKESIANFRSHTMLSIEKRELNSQINESLSKIEDSMHNYQAEGSGWIYDSTKLWCLYVYKYAPLKPKSYIPTPPAIKSKHAVLNIQNNDNKCFLWSILAALHPRSYKENANQVFYYKSYENELNMSNITYPVKLNDIDKFERQNNISVNVFGIEDGKLIYPLKITKQLYPTHVNLLLIQQGQTTHYCLIRDFNKLMFNTTKDNRKKHYCYLCLQRFSSKDCLDKHLTYCKNFESQRVELSNKQILQFTNYKYQLKAPFVIYADFECFIDPTTNEHTPSGFAFVVVSDCEIVHEELYSGEGVMDVFFQKLFEVYDEIKRQMTINLPLMMTSEDEAIFQSATHCHICEKPLGTDRVRDHCHRTGRFRNAAHNECNLNFKLTKKIPVLFHNLKNYDGHLIMQHLGKIKNRKFNCIAKDMEHYISFSIDDLVFLDSYNFLALPT